MSGLVATCAVSTALLGVGLAGWGGTSLFRGGLPLALAVTLVCAGILLLGLALGLARRKRAAWSFSVAVLGVLSAASLLAIPALVRAGLPAPLAGVVLTVVLGLLAALVSGREAF